MIVKHFDVSTPQTKPPQKEGWEQAWYGYHRMTRCWSEEMRQKFSEQIKSTCAKGELNESQFERDCFLSVLANIEKEHVNMFEIGAGWGEWCLALAGVIDHKVIPIKPVSYRCLAVEGEPTHYQWLKKHFEIHDINGIAVHGAVSDKNGICHFNTSAPPDVWYGQAITYHKLSTKEIIRYLRSFVLKKATIKVPMYTLDYLKEAYEFDHIDIVDIDVEGAEFDVMQGATNSIKDDLIDYLLIGTHEKKLNDKLRQLLSPKFDLVVDIYPNSVGIVDGFPPVKCQDGIQLYKRKNI